MILRPRPFRFLDALVLKHLNRLEQLLGKWNYAGWVRGRIARKQTIELQLFVQFPHPVEILFEQPSVARIKWQHDKQRPDLWRFRNRPADGRHSGNHGTFRRFLNSASFSGFLCSISLNRTRNEFSSASLTGGISVDCSFLKISALVLPSRICL